MTTCILIASPLFANELGRFLPMLYLAGALIVGALVIYFVSWWRRREARFSPNDSEQLAQYELLRKQGAISEEEYRKLRAVLTGEIRRAAGLPPRNEAIAPPPTVTDPPPAPESPGDAGIRPA